MRQKRRFPRRFLRGMPAGLAVAAALSACREAGDGDDPELEAPLPVDGAVSSDTPEATVAGLQVLARGGNAVDAAVAVSLVLGVTEPSESGLGGSAVVLIVPEGGAGVFIDASDPAGAAGAAGVPSALLVLHHAWRRFGSGKLTWAELVEPAVRNATDGYSLGRFTHRTIVREYDRVIADPAATLQLLAPDRSIPAEGSLVTNPPLASVLERIAQEGPEGFYGGEVAQQMVRALSARGVPVDAAQIAAARPVREIRAVQGRYRGLTIWGAPGPHGGPAMLRAMELLELAPRAWLASPGWARSGWLAEALAFAWSGEGKHPIEHLAVLGPMPAPQGAAEVQALEALAKAREREARPDSAPSPPSPPGREADAPSDSSPRAPAAEPRRPFGAEPGATSHFSVVDGDGMAVSVTQTLGGSFGSGPVEGLGLFYQNDHAPEEAPLVPTVVTRDGRVELVLGSPGGERGLAAVLEVLFRIIDLEQPLADAVAAPRLHLSRPTEESRGRLFVEGISRQDTLPVRQSGRAEWGQAVEALARERGFEVGEQGTGPVVEGLHPWFGGVNAIRRGAGSWEAAGDPRRGGVGGVVEQGVSSIERTEGALMRRREAPEG